MSLKKYIIKYLIIILSIWLLRILTILIFPELYSTTIIGEGYTQTKTTLFSMYQSNIFNIILAILLSFDLKKIKSNYIIIPILTVISMIVGLFFFSIIILDNLIQKKDEI